MCRIAALGFVLLVCFLEARALSCSCGIENIGKKIIGGSPAQPNRYPWMVYVHGALLCGGTLINDRYVMTAAHCVKGHVIQKVHFGVHTQADIKRSAGEKVSQVIIHDSYTGAVTSQGDVALLKLVKPVTFTDKVRPICLGTQRNPSNLFLTGWGLTVPKTREVGQQLNEVNLQPVPDHICKSKYAPDTFVDTNNQMCAGQSGLSSCTGDSGGPLSTRGNGKVYQLGVVSYGKTDCGLQTNVPAVYSRVAAYMTWIKSNTKDAVYCN